MNFEQAESFAKNVVSRNENRGMPVISFYEINYEKIQKKFKILKFDQPDDLWLDFVYANRTMKYTGEFYDMVIGPVANDTVYRVLRLFENGDLDRETVIKRLKISKLFNQIAFCTEDAVAELKFLKSGIVKNG